MKKNILGAVSICMLGMPMVSFAGDTQTTAKIKALEAKLMELQKQINELKEGQEIAVNTKPSGTAEKNNKKENQVIKPVVEPGIKINSNLGSVVLDKSQKSENKDYKGDAGVHTVNLGGEFQIDTAFYRDDKRDYPDGSRFKQSEIGIDGDVGEDWKYKFITDFTDNKPRIKFAYGIYSGFEDLQVKIGQFKEPIGFEQLMSDKTHMLMDRAVAPISKAAIGLTVARKEKNWTYELGGFNGGAGDGSGDDEAHSFTGRATVAPINDGGKLMHFGVSTSYRVPEQSESPVTRISFAPSSVGDLKMADTGDILDVDYSLYSGLEFASSIDNVSFQSEYMRMDVERNAGLQSLSFDAYYAQIAWMMTGENRPYTSSGIFGKVTPKKNFSIKNGGTGAFELAARYGRDDLTDKDIRGGVVDHYTLGLNWYVNPYVKFMANYVWINTDNSATAGSLVPNDNPEVFILRSQIEF